MKTKEEYKVIESEDLKELSTLTNRSFRVVLKGKPKDLPVYEIPIKYLYFNIENGRYADRMIKLRSNNPGVSIDPKQPKWRDDIKDMLLGTSKHTLPGWGDKVAADRLKDDIEKRTQLVPGLVAHDGGVLDGNRRLAVLMELGREYFDGVILPMDTPVEDKWRIEAGLQLGKPIVQPYSPVNELLKVREGLEIFRRLKRDGRDPSPNKSPEKLVAEAIYGRDEKEIQDWLDRINLMDQYLEFINKKGRYDLIGDRSERFLESVKVVEAAKNQGWKPDLMERLKAWLFHQILEREISNWDLREIYKIIGGDPTKRGKKPREKTKARDSFVQGLPDSRKIREICIHTADIEDADINNIKKPDKKKPEKHDDVRVKSLELKDETLGSAQIEEKEDTPIKKLEEARDRLDVVRGSVDIIKRSGKKEFAVRLLKRISNIADDCMKLLQGK